MPPTNSPPPPQPSPHTPQRPVLPPRPAWTFRRVQRKAGLGPPRVGSDGWAKTKLPKKKKRRWHSMGTRCVLTVTARFHAAGTASLPPPGRDRSQEARCNAVFLFRSYIVAVLLTTVKTCLCQEVRYEDATCKVQAQWQLGGRPSAHILARVGSSLTAVRYTEGVCSVGGESRDVRPLPRNPTAHAPQDGLWAGAGSCVRVRCRRRGSTVRVQAGVNHSFGHLSYR